jgi:transcription initiation factor TFIID subunit 9B
MGDAPREALAVAAVLRAQGAPAWEPRVVAQLLEFSYRHVADTLEEARQYAAHRARDAPISLADVRLAAQCALTNTFTEPLAGEELARIVAPLNAVPLPPLTARPGLLVPAEGTLLAPNFQARAQARVLARTGACGSTDARVPQLLAPPKLVRAAPAPAPAALPAPGAAPPPESAAAFRLPAAVSKRRRIEELADDAPPADAGDDAGGDDML